MKSNYKYLSNQYDSMYIEIWKIEQGFIRTRWTVVTFFLSVSFAIFGLSFQAQVIPTFTNHAQRIVAIIFYWFAFTLFVQFHRYTNFLRKQLKKMENDKSVTFSFQIEADHNLYSRFAKLFRPTWLLLYFGILYSIGAALLIVFHI